MPDLLFEIGSEEIPAGYIHPALNFMKKSLSDFFQQHRIEVGKPKLMGTPRRLAIWFPGVVARQPDIVEVFNGPSVKVAFDGEGNPTKAAIGFAKKFGVSLDELKREETSKGEVICARVEKIGEPTADLLNKFLPEIIKSIPFPKKMRWSIKKKPFARPIHWIAAIFESQILKFEFEGISSGNKSYGHRFLSPGSFEFNSLDDYLRRGLENHLLVDLDERKRNVLNQVQSLAKEVNGQIKEEAGLLNTVTNLVEFPFAIRGEFEKKYLKLPKELLVITMTYHQKYFPIWSGDELLPYFITISNMKMEKDNTIQLGNQRVLRARLEDARFFYDEDRKRKLEDYVENLKGVIFQKDLGTSFEKVMRIVALVKLFENFVKEKDAIQVAERAAYLCKADLVTQMVYEFPELQGIMGGYYAEHSNEGSQIAIAIKEHYKPAFAEDSLPSTLPGALVALADKLDTITGCISVKLIPSGSEDPYGLRRHALGIIQILIKYDLQVDLEWLIDLGIGQLKSKAKLSEEEIRSHCKDLFSQRLKTLLNAEGYEYDVIDAVLATKIDSFKNTKEKAKALSELKKQSYFEPLAIAFRRVVSILTKETGEQVDPNLLTEPAEKKLFEKLLEIRKPFIKFMDKREYDQALAIIVGAKDEIDNFFDNVMVNVEDQALRSNRLALLKSVSELFSQIGDFSKIVFKKS